MNSNIMVNTIWDDFCDYWPSLSNEVADYYRSGKYEVTLIFKDGRKRYYNYLNKTLQTIGPRNIECDDDTWKRDFAIVLKRKMKDRFMTQKILSDRTGISTVSINGYINGRTMPTARNIQRLAEALECSVSELIDFDI